MASRFRAAPAMTFVVLAALIALACAGTPAARPSPLLELRREGPSLRDGARAGRWLLAELISPGGDTRHARTARQRLEALGARDMHSHLAQALDDALHGRAEQAAEGYLRVVQAARDSSDPNAALIAWFAIHEAVLLEPSTTELWQRWRPFVERANAAPRALGWRARSELVDWALGKAWAEAKGDVAERAAELFGCVKNVRLAGPFGRNVPGDAFRAFGAEGPGAWPVRWEPEPGVDVPPRQLKVEQHGCSVEADEPAPEGMFYAESFIDLAEPRDVLLAVQGALALRVDDTLVLDRDIRKWGVWPRFGVLLRLDAGRHRIVARLGEPATSVRVMNPDGTPLALRSDSDPRRPYAVVPPKVGGEPNEVMRFIRDDNVVDPGDDVTRYIAAYLAHIEGNDDVASVMVEPLIRDVKQATGPSLALAAVFAERDPIFDSSQTEDMIRELHQRAVQKDPQLWGAQLSLLLGEAGRKGAAEVVPKLERLAKRFPQVPEVLMSLARVYGELNWTSEHVATVKRLVKRFPHDLSALHAAIDVYDAEGNHAAVDRFIAEVEALDPDSEVRLNRALARADYDAALAELRRLEKRRPSRKDLAERIHDVMVRAGNTAETWRKLEAAIAQAPTDGRPRLELADARFAQGDHAALRKALADAVQSGADTSPLSFAIDLVEGMTALEPYRLDAKSVIAAYEKSGQHMPGTAARVLDYAAVWVRADGSSRMLEHEIIRLQSAEAIANFAEHRRLEGLVLAMRVIKQDGSTLEPEMVEGKPTVTLPHLEVGDYIETEQVLSIRSDGRGTRYIGPRWFFREENVAYARSEFVIVTPRDKRLIIETTGGVPPPEVKQEGSLVSRRWRVDFSPAAPVEPNSPPVSDFLPSVRVGWGFRLSDRLEQLADAVVDVTPMDPRVVRVAKRIVEPIPARDALGRARKLYRWVLDNIEHADEADGRRVIMSKHGNRWRAFMTLCRALDISVRYAVAKNRLAAAPMGPFSEAATFSEPVLRLEAGKRAIWLTLSSKYAPFGYVPAEARGMPAYFLEGEGTESVRLPEEGAEDSLAFEGQGELAPDGSLKLELVERFTGRLAMGLREGLSQLPEHRMRDALESNLLARMLQGARLVSYEIRARDDLDAPLVLSMKVEVPRFAQRTGDALVLSAPFSVPIGRLAALPGRQTPLLISESLHRRVLVRVKLPRGARVDGVARADFSNGPRRVSIEDLVKGDVLVIDRSIDVPAGRIPPASYSAFADFAQRADDALSRAIRVRLP